MWEQTVFPFVLTVLHLENPVEDLNLSAQHTYMYVHTGSYWVPVGSCRSLPWRVPVELRALKCRSERAVPPPSLCRCRPLPVATFSGCCWRSSPRVQGGRVTPWTSKTVIIRILIVVVANHGGAANIYIPPSRRELYANSGPGLKTMHNKPCPKQPSRVYGLDLYIDAYSYLNFYRCEFFIISPKIRYCSYQNIARINIVLSFSFSKLLFHSMTSWYIIWIFSIILLVKESRQN